MDFDKIQVGDIVYVKNASLRGRSHYKPEPAFVKILRIEKSSSGAVHSVLGFLLDQTISNYGYVEYFYYRDEVLDPPYKKSVPRKNVKSKIIGEEVMQW